MLNVLRETSKSSHRLPRKRRGKFDKTEKTLLAKRKFILLEKNSRKMDGARSDCKPEPLKRKLSTFAEVTRSAGILQKKSSEIKMEVLTDCECARRQKTEPKD